MKSRKRKRKSRTGNGTSAIQHLYHVANPTLAIGCVVLCILAGAPWWFTTIVSPFFILSKIGITGNIKRRMDNIKKTSPGPDVPLANVRIPFAYQIEQFFHRVLSFLHCPWFGSGKTEWVIGLWGPVGLFATYILMIVL